MKIGKLTLATLFAVVFGLLVLAPGVARAHCDTMSGPVVTAARQALDTGNVNLVLRQDRRSCSGPDHRNALMRRTGAVDHR